MDDLISRPEEGTDSSLLFRVEEVPVPEGWSGCMAGRVAKHVSEAYLRSCFLWLISRPKF